MQLRLNYSSCWSRVTSRPIFAEATTQKPLSDWLCSFKVNLKVFLVEWVRAPYNGRRQYLYMFVVPAFSGVLGRSRHFFIRSKTYHDFFHTIQVRNRINRRGIRYLRPFSQDLQKSHTSPRLWLGRGPDHWTLSSHTISYRPSTPSRHASLKERFCAYPWVNVLLSPSEKIPQLCNQHSLYQIFPSRMSRTESRRPSSTVYPFCPPPLRKIVYAPAYLSLLIYSLIRVRIHVIYS